MKRILIVVAMKEEAESIINYLGLNFVSNHTYTRVKDNNVITLIITGVGMTNAARGLTKANYRDYNVIVNIGYVGSRGISVGSWVSVSNVFEHDFDISPVGIDMHMDPSNISNYENLIADSKLINAPCYSGSSFVTNNVINKNTYVVDMEAYMVVTLAEALNKKVKIYKLVSDSIDGKEFNESMNNALMGSKIKELFESYDILS